MHTPRVERAISKRRRLCVGLLSGTSVDAAEAALCEIEGAGDTVRLRLVSHVSLPFEAAFSARVLSADTAKDICELNFALGERFAEAALAVIAKAKLSPEDIDVIGSHGQTIAHWPGGTSREASTLQIGEPAIIAERTGIPTVSDFRTRDMAVGGQGAPLVPYFDWAVFRKPGATRAFLNIGGIANVSAVRDRLEDTIAFDTGPGNMLLDSLAQKLTGGALSCDLDGQLSGKGTVLPGLLDTLLAHPFFSKPPPKSTGRETFGEGFAQKMWEEHADQPHDLLKTAVAFTVEAIARAVHTWVSSNIQPESMYVSGGGSRNPVLLQMLRERLAPLTVERLSSLGFPEEAKEAACFALLASEFLSGVPQNIPSATGARKSVILGKMVP